MHQTQWSPERPLPPPVSLTSQSHHEKPPDNIVHSKCYSEMGLLRTGCCSCPFGRDFETELSLTERYEPKLYTAVNNIFKDAYEYTRMYREFQKKMKEREINHIQN